MMHAFVKCMYTDNNMTISQEGSTLLDACPPVITITQTVHIVVSTYPPPVMLVSTNRRRGDVAVVSSL